MFLNGKLELQINSATIGKKVSKSAELFVVVHIGKVEDSTAAVKAMGKTVTWNELFSFDIEGQANFQLSVFSKSSCKTKAIGSDVFWLTNFRPNTLTHDDYLIYDNGAHVGNLSVDIQLRTETPLHNLTLNPAIKATYYSAKSSPVTKYSQTASDRDSVFKNRSECKHSHFFNF